MPLDEIEGAVDALIGRLRRDYGESSMEVKKQKMPNDLAWEWSIEPTISQASPVWIIGAGWNDATGGFGRSSCRIELWQMGKTTPVEAELNLEKVCRSVIEGRLTEWRQNGRKCRYEIVLPDGEVMHGMANAFFRRRWKITERFGPYSPQVSPGSAEPA